MIRGKRSSLAALLATAVALAALAASHAAWAAGASASPPGWDDFTVDLGHMHQSVSGNERRFDQYVVQPSGLYPGLLAWQVYDPNGSLPYLDLSLRDLGEPGPSGDLYMLWGDRAVFQGRFRRSAFYPDFGSDVPQAAKSDREFSLSSPAGPDSRTYWRSSYDKWTLDADDVWRQRRWNNTVGFHAGGYDVSLNYRHDSFDFLSQHIFSGASKSVGLSFASTAMGNTSVEGAFSVDSVDLDGIGEGSRATNAEVTMTRAVRDNLSLWAQLLRHHISHTITETAYAKTTSSAHVEARYAPSPRTYLTGFLQTGRVDYVDGTQTSVVDVPTNTFGLDVHTRPRQGMSLRARYQHQTNTNRPLYHTIGGPLGNTLIFGTQVRLQFSGSYTPLGKPWGLSGDWTRETWTNDAQSTDNQVKLKTLTAWWQPPKSKLSFTGTWMRQNFDLPAVDVVTRLPYTTEAQDWVLVAGYQMDPRTSVSTTYVRSRGIGANETGDTYTLLSLTHRAGTHDFLTAEVALSTATDAVDNSLAYDADLYHLAWQREF